MRLSVSPPLPVAVPCDPSVSQSPCCRHCTAAKWVELGRRVISGVGQHWWRVTTQMINTRPPQGALICPPETDPPLKGGATGQLPWRASLPSPPPSTPLLLISKRKTGTGAPDQQCSIPTQISLFPTHLKGPGLWPVSGDKPVPARCISRHLKACPLRFKQHEC